MNANQLLNGRSLSKTRPSGSGKTTSFRIEVSPMITSRRILYEIELLDWSGHVELPYSDMQWLASQLFVRLNRTDAEVCDACNKAAPLVLTTVLGSICAECLEDWQDNIDQARDAMNDE
jgi:hypothetical protein